MHFEAITLLYILNGIELKKKKCCCFFKIFKIIFFFLFLLLVIFCSVLCLKISNKFLVPSPTFFSHKI